MHPSAEQTVSDAEVSQDFLPCRLGLSVISHPSFLDGDPKDTHSLTPSIFFCGGNGLQRMSKQINKSSVCVVLSMLSV